MTRVLSLEDFSRTATFARLDDAPLAPWPSEPAPSEADTLEAFDNGYKNGWSDCARAEAEERQGISADLAKNLSEAALTYEAARRDILAALGPFFEDIVSTLLPSMAAAAVAPCVLEELTALSDGHLQARIEVHAAPSTCPALERLAETEGIEGMILHPEPAFAEGQVSLRLGAERRDIDMAAAAARIADAIAAFQSQTAQSVPALSQGAPR